MFGIFCVLAYKEVWVCVIIVRVVLFPSITFDLTKDFHETNTKIVPLEATHIFDF